MKGYVNWSPSTQFKLIIIIIPKLIMQINNPKQYKETEC